MEKSKLTEAAYDGATARVKKLVASGARVDGSDNETYDDTADGCLTGAPYYRPLSEAARAGRTEIVKVLLAAGAPVDAPNYRNETALILAAGAEGGAPCVEVLLEAGANIEHVGCFGTALAYVEARHGVRAAKLLLAAGAKLDTKDSFGRTALTRLLPGYGRQLAKSDVEALPLMRVLLPYARGEDADMIEGYIRALENLDGKSGAKAAATTARFTKLVAPAALANADWPSTVRAHLGPLTAEKSRESVRHVCAQVLAAPSAIAHPAWPALVREVVALSQSYGDATEAAYGERLRVDQMEDDEGGAMDAYADEHLYTWDWVLEALATPAAIAHPKWAELVIELCEHKRAAVGYYSFGDDEIKSLLQASRAHPAFASVHAAATNAFPFAGLSTVKAKRPETKKAFATKAPATKSPAKKSPATKSPARKSPATKSPATKSPAKKSPAKKSPATKAPSKKRPPTKARTKR
jgi:hypothetical protein